MANIETINQLKEYFKKLQKVLNYEADFSIFGYELIKKSKIDDILCCILAILPEPYKKIMKMTEGKKLGSVLAYNLLFNAVKQKFILNSDVYLVNKENVKSYINTIVRDIERDITYAEKNV